MKQRDPRVKAMAKLALVEQAAQDARAAEARLASAAEREKREAALRVEAARAAEEREAELVPNYGLFPYNP